MGIGNKTCECMALFKDALLTLWDRYEVNPNHGSSADLKALSAALHARGMYLMVDVVANHMVSYPTHTSRKTFF